jgi:hypothetical protein
MSRSLEGRTFLNLILQRLGDARRPRAVASLILDRVDARGLDRERACDGVDIRGVAVPHVRPAAH